RREPLVQVLAPVIRHNLVKRVHDVLESVGHDARRAALAAVKQMYEIVQRLLALALLANEGINFKPDQLAFVVEVSAAPPGKPCGGRLIKKLRGDRGIN